MKKTVLSAFILLVLLAACSAPAAQNGGIQILQPWARTAEAGGNTGAFMRIKNSGDAADKLIKAEFSGAMSTEIHETKMVDQVMEMAPVEALEIPAKGEVELKPGSFHVMIMGLKQELKAGDTLSLTLTFEKAGSIQVEMKAQNP